MFSAKKIKGRRLYKLARQGKEIEREELPVNIYKNKLLELRVPECLWKSSAVKVPISAR